jgi:hypothetical protein
MLILLSTNAEWHMANSWIALVIQVVIVQNELFFAKFIITMYSWNFFKKLVAILRNSMCIKHTKKYFILISRFKFQILKKFLCIWMSSGTFKKCLVLWRKSSSLIPPHIIPGALFIRWDIWTSFLFMIHKICLIFQIKLICELMKQ